MTLEQKILARIRKEKVKPTPRGYFALRNTSIWIIITVSVVALGLTTAMVIFFAGSTDSAVLDKLGITGVDRVLSSVPLVWIALALLIAGVVYVSVRRTSRGYRISTWRFATFTGATAIILGSALYASDISEYIDRLAYRNIPLYTSIVPVNTETWFDPEHGLLSGTIKEKDSDSAFTMRDRDQELWEITGDDIRMPEDYSFHPGDRVKMIGKKTGPYTFEVREVYPWLE